MLQDIHMRPRYPQFKMSGHGARASWVGQLSSRPGSSYRIRIAYGAFGRPRVFLLDPPMREDCPHTWGGGEMCVFWPKDPDHPGWQPGSWIADTILPWSQLWLHYYELWLETGEWRGPEHGHTGSKE